jgi:two-component system invasion response regulator UvrY
MARVLIADDHAVVRAGYKQFLETELGIAEIGEAGGGDEVMTQLAGGRWDLLLLDIHMPNHTGLEMLEKIRQQHPDVRILIVSGLPEEQYARNVLRAGASGYLSKSTAPQDLVTAVKRILSGQRYVSQQTAERMVADLGKPNLPLHELLSERELQVFKRLAAGAMITGIAHELTLSVKTVSTYRTRILDKMGFTSNADITAYAVRHHILD